MTALSNTSHRGCSRVIRATATERIFNRTPGTIQCKVKDAFLCHRPVDNYRNKLTALQ